MRRSSRYSCPNFAVARRIFLLGWVIGFFIGGATVGAGMREDTGWTELQTLLGPAMPQGAGVSVLHVEGSLSVTENRFVAQAHAAFTPILPLETTTFPGSGVFAGKTFELMSASSGVASWHALGVANQWYHGTTGLSPQVTAVGTMVAGDFVVRLGNETLDSYSLAPIQNHSWIYFDASLGSANTPLRDYDQYLATHGLVGVVGLANNDTVGVAGIPPLWAPAYHVIAVGRSDGLHKTGVTPVGLDGPGRMKPDIVCVSGDLGQTTSWSTGAVSGIMTVLWQEMLAKHPGVTGIRRSQALKAILLAGADKSKFPLWKRQTTATPYDGVFGAGEADVFRSWQVLAVSSPVPPGPVAGSGWNAESPPNGISTRDYTFTVPSGKFATLSCALVWHRKFAPNGNPSLTNLSLTLERLTAPAGVIDQSNSAVDNVEYLHRYHLPAGSYRMRVSGLNQTAHAIAWHLATGDGPKMVCQRAESTGSLELQASGLDPYVTYTVETSATLDAGSWTTHATIHRATDPAPGFTWSLPVTATPPGRFFRLRWNPP